MNKKQKVRIKIQRNEHRHFLESNIVIVNRLFVLIYLNRENDVKGFKIRRYNLPNGIIKNHVIINRKKIYDQAIDSDRKRLIN